MKWIIYSMFLLQGDINYRLVESFQFTTLDTCKMYFSLNMYPLTYGLKKHMELTYGPPDSGKYMFLEMGCIPYTDGLPDLENKKILMHRKNKGIDI